MPTYAMKTTEFESMWTAVTTSAYLSTLPVLKAMLGMSRSALRQRG